MVAEPDDAVQAIAVEAGRRLFARPCDFVIGAASIAAIPAGELPEVAFAGRSNVGKSSLLNRLTGRKTLARTSNTPGRTQQLNFFDLGHRLMLVDLPGYGYAAAPKTAVAAWQRLLRAYLRGRANLRRLCLLVDARHGLKDPDREMLALLDAAAVAYQVVLTKADKLKPPALARRVEEVAAALAAHPAALTEVLATSAVSDAGVPELRAALAPLAAPEALR